MLVSRKPHHGSQSKKTVGLERNGSNVASKDNGYILCSLRNRALFVLYAKSQLKAGSVVYIHLCTTSNDIQTAFRDLICNEGMLNDMI